MKKTILFLIAQYRRWVSPLLGARCRFEPNCSAYAESAFERKNFLTALRLTAVRLLKCQPFHSGGFDPVE